MRDALREAFPGTGDSAAMTVHTVRSVGCGAPVRSHGSPAREPDSRQLQIDESWRGYGLLADRASASRDRLRACDAHGVRCVIRLQEHGKPKVDSLARGQVTQACFPGTDLDALLEDDTLVLGGRAIDAAGHIGRGRHALALRLVGVQTPKGAGCFLTHLPPRIGPRQVAALLAHTHHVKTRPQQPGAPRTEAPLHPRRLALPLALSCQSIAQAFELQGAEATPRWHKIAAWLRQSGRAPNWRRRPSVLDQLRGWKRQPLARKEANSGDVNHCHVKAAASVDTYALSVI